MRGVSSASAGASLPGRIDVVQDRQLLDRRAPHVFGGVGQRGDDRRHRLLEAEIAGDANRAFAHAGIGVGHGRRGCALQCRLAPIALIAAMAARRTVALGMPEHTHQPVERGRGSAEIAERRRRRGRDIGV